MVNDKELQRRRRWLRIVKRVYSWSLWGFVVVLQLTQVLGGVPSVQIRRDFHAVYGQSPLQGLSEIPGTNDDPFTDRLVVCSLTGRLYKPQQLSTAIAMAASNSSLVGSSSSSVNGYRVLERQDLVMPPHVYIHYLNTCKQLATTVDNIRSICMRLGYDISATYLRVVVDHKQGQDVDATLVSLPTTLPVLILPYWDNGVFARFVIPGEDGSACVFRLDGKYNNPESAVSVLRAVNRSVRETATATWLNLHGGTWRHGWYELQPPEASRWYSDVISTGGTDTLDIFNRHFNTTSGRETDCSVVQACAEVPMKEWWGTDLFVVEQSRWYHSVTVTNGRREGLFLFENAYTRYVACIYRLETLLSNITMAYLLFRWLVALVALPLTEETVGVGVLACARSFQLLPLIFLPRLKTVLAAVFVAGCYFEGDQKSLSEAYFLVYPSISEFTMLLFSLLSLLAKILRLRVSDVLFGPTLLLWTLIYYFRLEIAQFGWFGIPGRVTSVVSASAFEAAPLSDFFTTKLAYRMNGEITSLFVFKTVLLAVQLVPLAVGSVSTSIRSQSQQIAAVERAMALRVALNGGIGQSQIHVALRSTDFRAEEDKSPAPKVAMVQLAQGRLVKRRSTKPRELQLTVVPFEVLRAGFLVLGDDVLLSIHDWCWFMFSAPFRLCGLPMDHLLVMAWTLDREDPGDQKDEVIRKLKSDRPLMYRVTDDRLRDVRAWDIKSFGVL